MSQNSSLVPALRQFNRFYTRRVGFLEATLDESPFTLAQARVLFEIGNADPEAGLSASDIKETLGLDAAYLARILKKLAAGGIVQRRSDPGDRRRRIVELTAKGRAAWSELQQATNARMGELVATVSPGDATSLIAALAETERLLGGEKALPGPVVLRPHRIGDVGWVIERQSRMYAGEYGWNDEYEALVCEIGAKFLREFQPGREFCWIAERDGERLGAVFLVRRNEEEGQLRMLHVEPAARGMGIGQQLVETCIAAARDTGCKKLVLWTNDVLGAARRIYQRTGFVLVSQDSHHSFGHDLHGQNWELTL